MAYWHYRDPRCRRLCLRRVAGVVRNVRALVKLLLAAGKPGTHAKKRPVAAMMAGLAGDV